MVSGTVSLVHDSGKAAETGGETGEGTAGGTSDGTAGGTSDGTAGGTSK